MLLFDIKKFHFFFFILYCLYFIKNKIIYFTNLKKIGIKKISVKKINLIITLNVGQKN